VVHEGHRSLLGQGFGRWGRHHAPFDPLTLKDPDVVCENLRELTFSGDFAFELDCLP
jgi:hypothetical protein